MKKEIDILAELKEWGSPLADMSRAMPYNMPKGYFESNLKRIVSYAIVDDKITTGSKEQPFTVPEGYFNDLPVQMLEMAKAESFNESTAKYQAPYVVPEGYFDALPAQILAQAKNKSFRKTIAFIPRVWMRQAVAAILLVALGIGGYEYANYRHANPEKQLANAPETSVREYVHQNLNDVDIDQQQAPVSDVTIVKATEQLDKNDIEQYLDETGLKTEYNLN